MTPPFDMDMLQRLGLAVTIGLLVGVERGWHTRDQHAGSRVAGIRTFTLIALLGGIWGLLGQLLGDLLLGISFLGFAALMVAAYMLSLNKKNDFGLTTEIAGLLTFSLGVLAVRGDMALAAGAAVVMVALLDAKKHLHRFIAHVEKLELDAAIRLLLISVVLLPVLPDKGFGPGGILNPYELWWIVVLISTISFIGYAAVRIGGARRGIILTALAAGLVSSTAVAVSLSRHGKRATTLRPYLSGGILLASAIMFIRILVLVSVLNVDLLPALAPAMAVMALTCAAVGVTFIVTAARQTDTTAATETLEVEDPAEIATAIKFGVFLAAVVALSHFMKIWFGEGGLYALATASGLADVDALTVSMARMAETGLAIPTAVTAIVFAAFANTVVKAVIVAIAGPREMALHVGGGFALALGLGVIVLVAT